MYTLNWLCWFGFFLHLFLRPVLAKRTYRELKLLKHIRHENIISLSDIFISPLEDIYFVTELLGTDLHRLLTSRPLEKQFIQYFLYQILVSSSYNLVIVMVPIWASFWYGLYTTGHLPVWSVARSKIRSLCWGCTSGFGGWWGNRNTWLLSPPLFFSGSLRSELHTHVCL